MAAFLTTLSALTCTHGGLVSLETSNGRTSTGSAAILRLEDQPFKIVPGTCTYSTPCTEAVFTASAAKSLILGSPPLTEDNLGTTLVDGLPVDVVLIPNPPAASGT